MEPGQVRLLIDQITDPMTPDEFLVALATKAAEHEREECAKVVEGYSTNWGRFYAWAIRARGLK